MRKMAATIKPTQEITVENGRWKIKTISTLKTTEIDFVIGDVFEETTADGRKVQVRWVPSQGFENLSLIAYQL
jgi:hypothetical protein